MTTDAAQGLAFTSHARGSSKRKTAGLVGQYAMLVVLAVLVLGPIYLTVIQGMSPPFKYLAAGKPLHPVAVAWKDRTWFTGGATSIILRTLVVAWFFTWIHKVGAGVSWKGWRALLHPARVISILAGIASLTVLTGWSFQSLYEADGQSGAWIISTMVIVALTQVPGFLVGGRAPAPALVCAATAGFFSVGLAIIGVGAVVWTQAWGQSRLGPAMAHSLVMAILITAAQVITSITSAYAFVFLRFPFQRLLFGLFMATLLLPLEVTLVGNVALIRQLGWIDSLQGLVLPFAATALGTFLIRQGFRGIPPEIQDATRLDGYGHISFLARFAVPLSRPVVASFTVIAALSAWNQYLWPRAIIDSEELSTLQIQLRTIVGGNVADSNVSVASALVAALPVVIVLIVFQRQIIRGLTAGAVK